MRKGWYVQQVLIPFRLPLVELLSLLRRINLTESILVVKNNKCVGEGAMLVIGLMPTKLWHWELKRKERGKKHAIWLVIGRHSVSTLPTSMAGALTCKAPVQRDSGAVKGAPVRRAMKKTLTVNSPSTSTQGLTDKGHCSSSSRSRRRLLLVLELTLLAHFYHRSWFVFPLIRNSSSPASADFSLDSFRLPLIMATQM